MVEAYLPIDEQVKYYEVSDFPFNFKLIGMRPAHLRPLSAQTVLNQIHKWIDNTPKGKLSNWVVRKIHFWISTSMQTKYLYFLTCQLIYYSIYFITFSLEIMIDLGSQVNMAFI